jgi:hypothetical protein
LLARVVRCDLTGAKVRARSVAVNADVDDYSESVAVDDSFAQEFELLPFCVSGSDNVNRLLRMLRHRNT